ncbi:MAG: hypothetical protein HQL07_07400 [Nitrospirae bacterium]|nr:hypothetical protein [Magnetococcales bacterium]
MWRLRTGCQVKGGMRSPFNLGAARRYDTWIWTEGEMDVLALAMAQDWSTHDRYPMGYATSRARWLGWSPFNPIWPR